MNGYEPKDDRELMDVPPDEPVGSCPVTFSVPVPRVEQVAGEIARQVLANNYNERGALNKLVREKLDAVVERIVSAKATPIIEALLEKPLQPTDNFGNPTGEPTSLHAVLALRVTQWCTDAVDSEGKAIKPDGYNSSRIASRMAWQLGKIVNGELKKQVDDEVNKIIKTLKADGTAMIAKQIAEKVSGMVLK